MSEPLAISLPHSQHTHIFTLSILCLLLLSWKFKRSCWFTASALQLHIKLVWNHWHVVSLPEWLVNIFLRVLIPWDLLNTAFSSVAWRACLLSCCLFVSYCTVIAALCFFLEFSLTLKNVSVLIFNAHPDPRMDKLWGDVSVVSLYTSVTSLPCCSYWFFDLLNAFKVILKKHCKGWTCTESVCKMFSVDMQLKCDL